MLFSSLATSSEGHKKPKSVIAGLGFKGAKGKADPKKRLDLEIKLVNRIIEQGEEYTKMGKTEDT